MCLPKYNRSLRVVPVVNHRRFTMIWLYRLQQRLSITRHESLAVITLASLFLLGLTVRHVQEQQVPPLDADSLIAQSVADSTSSPSPPEPAASSPSAEDPINVNTASRKALKALPGIGPALSERIVTYRSTQQSFQQVDELKHVSGIGPKTLETLRPMVRISPSADSSG